MDPSDLLKDIQEIRAMLSTLVNPVKISSIVVNSNNKRILNLF